MLRFAPGVSTGGPPDAPTSRSTRGAGAGAMSNEWDAEAYDRLSDPQYRWGKKVLDRIDLRGDETAIDAGCGTGRLTSVLLERLPRGRVIAIDGSQNMLNEAASRLVPRYGARVELVC